MALKVENTTACQGKQLSTTQNFCLVKCRGLKNSHCVLAFRATIQYIRIFKIDRPWLKLQPSLMPWPELIRAEAVTDPEPSPFSLPDVSWFKQVVRCDISASRWELIRTMISRTQWRSEDRRKKSADMCETSCARLWKCAQASSTCMTEVCECTRLTSC